MHNITPEKSLQVNTKLIHEYLQHSFNPEKQS
jgi:hypothetical protein